MTPNFTLGRKNPPFRAHQRVITTMEVNVPTDKRLDRPTELARLNPFIGRWITVGETAPSPGKAPIPINASDVYDWAPGGRFVVHPAYGRFGDLDVSGVEIIGLDPSSGQFSTHFFDGNGTVSTQTLSFENGTWMWRGKHTRCFGTFSADERTLVAGHERLDENERWIPSMTVTLRKVV